MIACAMPGAMPGHGEALPGGERGLVDDVCRCARCAAIDQQTLPASGGAITARGPVQDESGRLDPADRAAMRAVEGYQRWRRA